MFLSLLNVDAALLPAYHSFFSCIVYTDGLSEYWWTCSDHCRSFIVFEELFLKLYNLCDVPLKSVPLYQCLILSLHSVPCSGGITKSFVSLWEVQRELLLSFDSVLQLSVEVGRTSDALLNNVDELTCLFCQSSVIDAESLHCRMLASPAFPQKYRISKVKSNPLY